MKKFVENNNRDLEMQMLSSYFVVTDKKNGFHWVINLEDHPNSFLLDKSFQNFSSKYKENNQSMVIFQPTI